MRVEVILETGERLTLEKFGKELVCINPPPHFNKQRKDYIELKKKLLKIC